MRLRLLLLFLLLMTGGLVSLGLPLARGIAAAEGQALQLDRLRDVVRFASLAQARTEVTPEDDAGTTATAGDVAHRLLVADIQRYTWLYDIEVAVMDPAGEAYAGSLGRHARAANYEAEVTAALSGRVGETPRNLWPWDERPFVVAQPMISDGDVVGAVVSVSATADARARVLADWAQLAAVGLLALLVATLVAARMARWVLRPVGLLEGAAQSIAGGAFSTRVASEAGPPELRHLARSFNHMADHVQAVLAAQRTFVADASHQLRNPLNALLLRIEALRTDTRSTDTRSTDTRSTDPRRTDAVEAASAEGRHLAATLDRMLEMARAEHTTVEPAAIDVAAVVDERLQSWRIIAGRRSIDLRREGVTAVTGWQDGVALAGAVDTVIDNALKYSPEGAEVTVRVGARESGGAGGAVVEIDDSGAGMSPDDLAQASQRHWRSDEHSDVPGSGLGLSIASALLEQYGGRLEIGPRAEHPGLCVRLLIAAPPATDPGRPHRRRQRFSWR